MGYESTDQESLSDSESKDEDNRCPWCPKPSQFVCILQHPTMLGRQAVQQAPSHMDVAAQPLEPPPGKRWVLSLKPTCKLTRKSTTEQRSTPASG